MDQQQELRHAAAKAFIESLEHLQQTLEPLEDSAAAPALYANQNPAFSLSPGTPARFDLDALEDAIADIEQFIEKQTARDDDDPKEDNR
jgi:hypothetical protein